MIDLEQSRDGVLMPVRVQPGAGCSGIAGCHDGRLKVAVAEAPEKGKANTALLKVLAKSLGLPRSRLALVRGERSRKKLLLVGGIDADGLRRRIDRCCSDGGYEARFGESGSGDR